MRRSPMRVFGLLGAAALVALVLNAAAGAAGQVTVSPNPSVFDTSTCAAVVSAQTAAVPGTINYLNSEEEPYVAVDPTDGSHLRRAEGASHRLEMRHDF